MSTTAGTVALLLTLAHASQPSTQLAMVKSEEEGDDQLAKDVERMMRTDPESAGAVACFLCKQLLAAGGHRVGFSEPQLQQALHGKCRRLPLELSDHCINFADTFLNEIYFSLNYDFSSKNVCVALSICDKEDVEVLEREKKKEEKAKKEEDERVKKEQAEEAARKEEERLAREKMVKEAEAKAKRRREKIDAEAVEEEKRLNCMFCDRMLESVKQYAESVRADVRSFASTACGKWPRRRQASECSKLAQEKVNKLAKFVDEQVVEALWCSELYGCS